MVFAKFNSKIFTYLSFFFIVCASASANSSDPQSENPEQGSQWPVFAAQLSENVIELCHTQHCELNVFSADDLSSFLSQHPLNREVLEALSLSEYELLISSAVTSPDADHASLVMEMTTSWRGVPIDDFNVESPIDQNISVTGSSMINAWVERVQNEAVFDATRIYNIIGASDYLQQMQLPEKIGEFVFMETALYHDPMQGSISRYVHPQFSDAVIDISVYPVSPFVHKPDEKEALTSEMEIEKSHIQALIKQAQLDDYQISEITSTEFVSALGGLKGLSIEVALQTKIDPVYSTQFLFTQNDKFIKLTGNVPKHMMLALVEQSISQIKVPGESQFMQAMRQQ
jgi:hypothetical protein